MGSGYAGRIAVAEVVTVGPELRELIVARRPVDEIAALVRKSGIVDMATDGLRHVASGQTTLAEVRRVVDEVG
jgi:type II secretory ATPase GspE/PulE/Tfp pilus assembly ATPase PilB-like protein